MLFLYVLCYFYFSSSSTSFTLIRVCSLKHSIKRHSFCFGQILSRKVGQSAVPPPIPSGYAPVYAVISFLRSFSNDWNLQGFIIRGFLEKVPWNFFKKRHKTWNMYVKEHISVKFHTFSITKNNSYKRAFLALGLWPLIWKTYFKEHLWMTASVLWSIWTIVILLLLLKKGT